MKKVRTFLISIMCLLLPGCNNNNLAYYADTTPKMDMRTFFDGEVECWGTVFDYQGRMTRTFYASIKGSWNGDSGKLEEWFKFNDGEKTERVWNINYKDNQMFIANADDVIGDAKGEESGSAVNIQYTLRIPYKDSTIDLKMDDWMYRIEDGVVLNRTHMKKFGFKVGELVLFMKKKLV